MRQTTSTFSYTDLDRLSGEILPARLVLSAAGRSGTEIAYACQYVHSPGTAGLLGTGLLAQPGYTSMTCLPVVIHHSS